MASEHSLGSTTTIDIEWGVFVDGEYRRPTGGERIEVTNPATGERLTDVAAGTAADIDDAIAAARSAVADWRWTDPAQRATLLYRVADAIEDHEDELTTLECLENGKPMWQARNDVQVAARRFRFFAGGADKFYGETVSHTPDQVRMKVYEPYGVVGIIIPWNWPAMHTGDFLSVSLATGNATVLKPAPNTPTTSLRIAELAGEILPDGLVNVVPGGVEPGAALSSHSDVDLIAFTGSDAKVRR
jgi:aldehyde dehydrogenase (NAD+)